MIIGLRRLALALIAFGATPIALTIAAGTVGGAAADELTPIAIGYQLGVYGSLPLFIASEKGWWEKAGLAPSFVTFATAAPLLEAGAAEAWDVAALGGLAAVLGADRFALMTIGIADDESDANVVMARPGEVAAILKNPAILKGKELLLTPDTTAEYAALGCLAKWRLKREDLHVAALDPAQILATFAARNGRIAALSAPDNYRLFETGEAITVCSGKDGGATVPGALVARRQFTVDHPETVARFLAVFFRAIAWQKTHRDDTLEAMRRFYAQSAAKLQEGSLNKEIDSRPIFSLADQLQMLDRSKNGVSSADAWFGRLAAYALSSGMIQAPPLGQSYLTDRYVKWVEGDAELKAFVEAE